MDISNKRHIITTKDGSHSLMVPELNEQYHSIHGAQQEAEHVFLKMGLDYFEKDHLAVFEVGFGTGLNTLLSCLWGRRNNVSLDYTSVEKYPVSAKEANQLNYGELVEQPELFNQLHTCDWEQKVDVTKDFSLSKLKLDLTKDELPRGFDVIFFDAFAPNKQPKLWTIEVFEKMYAILNEGGVLVTYCCQGEAKRTMLKAGFKVEKVPGPPGKREMLRAVKC
ncbi:MAG: tRNA U34 5-methylaminomethyl-2-thiouridine-forming methyltransferase MnmC [Flavobacteriales bacterium]